MSLWGAGGGVGMVHMCLGEFPDSQTKELPEEIFTSSVAGSGASNDVLQVTSCFLFLMSALVSAAFILSKSTKWQVPSLHETNSTIPVKRERPFLIILAMSPQSTDRTPWPSPSHLSCAGAGGRDLGMGRAAACHLTETHQAECRDG